MTALNQFNNQVDDSGEISPVQLEELIELQSNILNELVSIDDGTELLVKLCVFAEKLTPDAVASIMLYDRDKQQLFVRVAPSIPETAILALQGLRAGDGSCGNAVYHNEDMYVCNTLTDARWDNVRDFAETYKINACWSSPIRDVKNEAIGSFALSSFATRKPDHFQRRLLNICASIAGIILHREAAISERQVWESKLRESQEDLAITIDSIAEGVISTDIDGNIMIFNRIAEQLTGCTREEAIGKNIDTVFNIIDEDDRGVVCQPDRCRLEKDKCYYLDKDIKIVSKDGTSRYIEISEASITNEQKAFAGVVMAFRDITTQRKDREELKESQYRYRTLVNNSADAIYLINAQGHFIDVNQMACDSLGYSRLELLRMSLHDITYQQSEVEYCLELLSTLDYDSTSTKQCVHKRKDGSQVPVEVRIRKYKSNNEDLFVAVSRDVSEREIAEKERLKVRKLESIGLLAGGIAHDFNNMLGIIQGYVDLSMRSIQAPEKQLKYLRKAYSASMQASELTQQLLTFSKGGEPIRKVTDIADIVHQSTEFNLHGSNVNASYHFSSNLWHADIDSGQISQVIQNLTINARQAMPDGGTITIYCENIEVTEASKTGNIEPNKYIELVLKDSGGGIPEEIIDSIFDPYFTTKKEGSGLGLALSYSIINKHGGYIFVDSHQGEGAAFTIYLPASETEADITEKDMTTANKQNTNACIMLMDDDPLLREVGGEMLGDLGYEVIQVNDGEAAEAEYLEAMNIGQKIDLVIMDLTIPSGIGGKEAIKLLQAIDPDVRALVSSGYCNDAVMANYEEFGFKGAISKPYSMDELAEAVQAILQS